MRWRHGYAFACLDGPTARHSCPKESEEARHDRSARHSCPKEGPGERRKPLKLYSRREAQRVAQRATTKAACSSPYCLKRIKTSTKLEDKSTMHVLPTVELQLAEAAHSAYQNRQMEVPQGSE